MSTHEVRAQTIELQCARRQIGAPVAVLPPCRRVTCPLVAHFALVASRGVGYSLAYLALPSLWLSTAVHSVRAKWPNGCLGRACELAQFDSGASLIEHDARRRRRRQGDQG